MRARGNIARLASLACIAAAVLAGCARQEAPSPVRVATVAVVSGLAGADGACLEEGAPGGLSALPARLAALRAEGPTALLFVGDTFVADGAAAPSSRRLDALVGALAELGLKAVARGRADLGAERARIEERARAARLPLFRPPDSPLPQRRIDSVVVRLGGLRVGVLGTPGAAAAEAASYTAGALALRAQGVDAVIALVPEPARDALAFAAELDRVDVIVAGGAAAPLPARVVDGALLVEAGSGGRSLGLLRLYGDGGGAWVYDERGDEPMPPPERPTSRAVTFTLAPLVVGVSGGLGARSGGCPPPTHR